MRRLAIATVLAFSVTASAQTSRPFRMATTAIQADPGRNPTYQNTISSATLSATAGEADYISVFPEFLGIPYSEFATKTSPSSTHPWTIKMKALATQMKAAGKPIMLQLALTRSTKTKNALNIGGSWALEAGSDTLCFDFAGAANASVGTAYVNYVRWMRQQFGAAYVVVAVEANLYYVACGGDTASWRALVQIERNAYDAAKFLANVVAFPSFKLEEMYNLDVNGFDDAQYQAMSQLKRDRFGIASYPFGLRHADGSFFNPYELPIDYFLRVQTKYPTEKRVVITETGWNSSGIAIGYQGTCFADYIYSQEQFTRDYLLLLLYSGYVGNFDMITWWSDRDLIQSSLSNSCSVRATAPSYPECGSDPWCIDVNRLQDAQTMWDPAFSELVYKAFGTMGLRNYDGSAKPAVVSLWQQFYALPRI